MPDDTTSADGTTAVDAAIIWHLRLPGAGPDEWDAFTTWLDASPDHARAYDKLAADDALLTEALRPAEWTRMSNAGANVSSDRWWSHWRRGVAVAGTAVAAGTGFLLLPVDPSPPADALVLQTAPGVRRTARLADGSVVAMNGDTRVTLDRADPRRVTLDHGEAVFHVVHDAAHPFEVLSGDVWLQDVGTVFNVVSEAEGRGRRVSVQVAEGAVMFRPERDRLTLTAGAALTIAHDEARPHVTRMAAADVGSWRQDRLAFGATPLPVVAATLTRNLGTEVTVDPALARTSFTGSLSLAGGSARVVPRLARLLDTGWSRTGRRWTLTPRNHDPH